MSRTPRILTTTLLVAWVLGTTGASAQVTPAQYDRAMGLKAQWESLTEDVADPATWIDDGRFYYRTSTRSGHQFVLFDVGTRQKRPAFDHQKLAAALSSATGEPHTAARLPFNTFQFVDGERAIELRVGDGTLRCSLGDYSCERRERRTGQPRSFGAVRDLEVPADNTPKRSPDGRWEAFVQNDNVVVRRGGQPPVTVLSTDGSRRQLLRSGIARLVARLDEACRLPGAPRLPAAGPLRRDLARRTRSSRATSRSSTPSLATPSTWISRSIFHVAQKRQFNVADDQFPNPLSLSRLAWRQGQPHADLRVQRSAATRSTG